MENMNESISKKGNNKKILWVVIVLIFIILGLVFYIIYDKDVFHFKNSTDVLEKNQQNKEEKGEEINSNDLDDFNVKSNPLLQLDLSKCINNPDESYTLALYMNATKGINISLDSTRKSVSFSFNAHHISQNYSLGWVTSFEDYSMQVQTISFAEKISDIYLGGFGQSVTGDTLLILMNDGTVEYIPLKKAFAKDAYHLNSYGKLPNVEGVVKFYTANVTGGVTTLAQKADGSFYDLSTILQSTGNYS